MISNIIKKELLTHSSHINIITSKIDNIFFKKFLNETCSPCSITDIESSYYAKYDPSIIICNDRLVFLDKCLELAKFFHCPLLIIDHNEKSDLVVNKYKTTFDIYPVYQIALSNQIYLSWNRIQDNVLSYKVGDSASMSVWKNIIFNMCKECFIVTDHINENKKPS
jgi:hypothetical protein